MKLRGHDYVRSNSVNDEGCPRQEFLEEDWVLVIQRVH
jgi:hypothetical protein